VNVEKLLVKVLLKVKGQDATFWGVDGKSGLKIRTILTLLDGGASHVWFECYHPECRCPKDQLIRISKPAAIISLACSKYSCQRLRQVRLQAEP